MLLPTLRYRFLLAPCLLAVFGLATAQAQNNGATAPTDNSSSAPFSLDDWQAHLRAPEAPTRSQLYEGSDAGAPGLHSQPTAPVNISASHPANAPASAHTKTDNDRLVVIAVADRDFFQALNGNPTVWPETERNQRAQAIYDQYSQYIADHPDDVTAVVLYGKFLRRAGQPDLAYEVFRRADQLDPNLAVVKQQLANHFAEAGQPAPALDLLRQAEALAPAEPVYHYEMGELLNVFYNRFLAAKTFDAPGLDHTMEAEFARAAVLAPQEKGYAWRHAESYYDQRNPDWNAALAAWIALASQTTDPGELQALRLHQARALIELGRTGEARSLLALPVSNILATSRAALLKRLTTNPTSPSPPTAPAAGSAAPATS
jgi:tetratricopeptide (TPR) repeat protein